MKRKGVRKRTDYLLVPSVLPTTIIPQNLQYPCNYQCASHTFQLLYNSWAQFDFLSLQGSAVALETILPAPHLKRRRWADGLALKTHRPAWTLPCPSREAGERHLYVLAISEWGQGGVGGLGGGRDDTDLVMSCRVRAACGKLLTHRTHSAITAIIIIVTKAILIHFSGFLHSQNGSGFDRGVDSN